MRHNYALMLLIFGALWLAGCAPRDAQTGAVSKDPIAGVAIAAQVDGDTVYVPRVRIGQHGNTHFTIDDDGDSMSFMAYQLGGAIYVRANACPPCGSRGFTLVGDVLDCNACHTTFDARDGSGIQGACVDYPKASVPYQIVDDAITMKRVDLEAAWEETLVVG
jgi:uncharacterized membrane protein